MKEVNEEKEKKTGTEGEKKRIGEKSKKKQDKEIIVEKERGK